MLLAVPIAPHPPRFPRLVPIGLPKFPRLRPAPQPDPLGHWLKPTLPRLCWIAFSLAGQFPGPAPARWLGRQRKSRAGPAAELAPHPARFPGQLAPGFPKCSAPRRPLEPGIFGRGLKPSLPRLRRSPVRPARLPGSLPAGCPHPTPQPNSPLGLAVPKTRLGARFPGQMPIGSPGFPAQSPPAAPGPLGRGPKPWLPRRWRIPVRLARRLLHSVPAGWRFPSPQASCRAGQAVPMPRPPARLAGQVPIGFPTSPRLRQAPAEPTARPLSWMQPGRYSPPTPWPAAGCARGAWRPAWRSQAVRPSHC
jgi:hypothetical protein